MFDPRYFFPRAYFGNARFFFSYDDDIVWSPCFLPCWYLLFSENVACFLKMSPLCSSAFWYVAMLIRFIIHPKKHSTVVLYWHQAEVDSYPPVWKVTSSRPSLFTSALMVKYFVLIWNLYCSQWSTYHQYSWNQIRDSTLKNPLA